VVRHLHALHASLPSTRDGQQTARTIERSLGDPAAYLLIASRHEVQTAARAEGLNAAESFAIGKSTDLEALASQFPFPWVLKADRSWDGAGVRYAYSLADVRAFIRVAGAPPGLAKALKHLMVNRERAAIGEWLHAVESGLSAQRPVPGRPGSTVAACWRGEVLATISTEVLTSTAKDRNSLDVRSLAGEEAGAGGSATFGFHGFDFVLDAATARIIENQEMEKATRVMARRLGLSGFHDFDFMLDSASGKATLVEINPRITPPCHLNAGDGRDPVDAYCRRWLGIAPRRKPAVHPDPVVAYFPQAWAANPSDPLLSTPASDFPVEYPQLAHRVLQLVRREQRFRALTSRSGELLRRRARS
jgi:hypothetical protein